MEPTYTILGTDGNQYGPVSAEQIRNWAREGRVVAETQVWRSDTTAWVAAATLPEIGLTAPGAAPLPPASVAAAAPAPGPISAAVPTRKTELERRVKSGASWFYWIAAFSVINSIIAAAGAHGGWALGLGITSLIDALAMGTGGGTEVVAIVLNLGAAGIVAMFGLFAGKRHAWAFIIGMILLGMDTALTGLLQMWFSLALHAFALFSIFGGFKASRALRA